MLQTFLPAAAGFGKKFFEHHDAFFTQNAGTDLAAVVEVGGLEQIPKSPSSTAFHIRAAENDTPDPAVNDGAGTHGAGLLGDIEVAVCQPPVAQCAFSLGQREHFSMGCGVF